MSDDAFLEYLYYEKKLNPIELAFKSIDDLKKLKNEWRKKNGTSIETDEVFNKLSSLNKPIENDHLVSVIKKMTAKDSDQTKKVGSWIFYCLKGNAEKANNERDKVSEKYVNTITKYLDSFIKQLTNE